MTIEIGENFLLVSITKENWDASRDTFSNKEIIAKLFQIETILEDLKQGDLFVTTYYTTLSCYFQQLNLFETHESKCFDDNTLFPNIVEKKRTFKFLIGGLNKYLDEVRDRILDTYLVFEKFLIEVRREESKKQVML